MVKKMKEEKCSDCNGKVIYNFCSDRWECKDCGDINLFCPSERGDY